MTSVSIEGNVIRAVSPEGQAVEMPLSDFVKTLMHQPFDTGGVVVPDGTKLVYSRGRSTVLVHETPPQVRNLMWIANDSKKRWGGAKYRQVRIALPYVVVMATYDDGIVSDWNECFFRSAPLESEDGQVCYPAFLNCSRFEPQDGHPLSWICTQNLDRKAIMKASNRQMRYRVGLQSLMRCLLETGFNFSSEDHEGDSWFSQSTRVDPRIATIEKWEQTTKEQGPLFALEVPWIETGMSVRQVVERIFQYRGNESRKIASADDAARIVFNHDGKQ